MARSNCCPAAVALGSYRLWDIDTLINRALVNGTLSATLSAVLVGLVIGLQSLLSGLLGSIGVIGQDNGDAIVLSTVAIVIPFRPLGRRVHAFIDRRFYRRKYDAAQTLEAFSATLRQEVDLDALRARVLAVAQETMQPQHASLWPRPYSEREPGDMAHSWHQSAHGAHEGMADRCSPGQGGAPVIEAS